MSEFLSAELSQASGLSRRQLQYLADQKIVPPSIDMHKRRYSLAEAVTVMVMSELLKRGVSHQKAKQTAPRFRKLLASANLDSPACFLAVGYRKGASLAYGSDGILQKLLVSSGPAVVFSVSELVCRLKTQSLIASDERERAGA